jgi:hypothetical protein
MDSSTRITVFVPVCRTAEYLPRLYKSLLCQTNNNFEMLIVEDGTADMATVPVASWVADGRIKIRVLHQEHPGRHLAWNRAITESTTELVVQIDPDGAFVPEALEVIVGQWDAIADKERFAGVVCLCCRESGEVVGSPFVRSDTNNFEMRMIDKVTGEKGYVYHVPKLKGYSLPETQDGVAPDSVLHNRVSREKLLRCIPQALIIKPAPSEPTGAPVQPDGISLTARILQFNELNFFPMPLKLYLGVNSQYVQLSLLSGKRWGEIVNGAIRKRPMFFAAFISGFIGAAQVFRRRKVSGRRNKT